MVATLLGSDPSTILNAPSIGDVGITAQVLKALGATVEHDGDRITIDPTGFHGGKVPLSFSGLNRIPILLLGPHVPDLKRGGICNKTRKEITSRCNTTKGG